MKTYLWLCIAVVAMAFSLPVSSNDLIKNIVSQMEDQEGVATSTMYTLIAADDIAQTLKEQCAPAVMAEAQAFATEIRAALKNTYENSTDATVLMNTWTLYNKLQAAQDDMSTYPDSLFCAIKYILYDMQNRLREYHLTVMEKHDLKNDFGAFSTETLYGIELKKQLLDEKLAYYEQYQALVESELGVTLTYSLKNPSFANNGSEGRQELFDRLKRLMLLMVHTVIYDLSQKGILTDLDIQQLRDVTTFEFIESCDGFHGNYEIKETLDNKGNHISYETTALNLKVNYCPNFFVLRDVDMIMRKIITHELGHHVYYYTDKNVQSFESICRSDADTKKQSCNADDFVTDYAQTLSVEDYAEHFMHRMLDIVPAQTDVLQKKTKHFEEMFE